MARQQQATTPPAAPTRAPTRPRTAIEAMIAAIPDSGMISVGCKLPNGVILRLFDMVERTEVTQGGERTIKASVLKPDVEPVHIKGCAAPFGSPIQLFGGYALTHNVDAQFFKEWLRQNTDADIVKNRLVFAHESVSYLQDKAEERVEILSGMQPMAQENDPRAPRSARPGVSNIKAADDKDKAA